MLEGTELSSARFPQQKTKNKCCQLDLCKIARYYSNIFYSHFLSFPVLFQLHGKHTFLQFTVTSLLLGYTQ